MSPRALLLLSIVPLLAAEPGFSSAFGQGLQFGDEQLTQTLQQAEDMARQAGEKVLQSLQTLGRDIPQYGLPYLDRSGDIVIPRRNPELRQGTPIPAPGPSRA